MDKEADVLSPNPALPPLAWLKTFEAVARNGGIRSAGRELGLHHSVISRRIAQLEAWLGVNLRDQDARRFTLTSTGALYHDRIAAPLREIEGATRDIMSQPEDPVLHIWCSRGLSVQWLASRVSEFQQQYPSHSVDLRPSDRPANLKAYEADADMHLHLYGDGPLATDPNIVVYELGRPTSLIAASPALRDRMPPILSATDLLDCPLLHSSNRDEWRLWFAMNGFEIDYDIPGEICWDPHMALEAARLGRGLLWGNTLFFERSFARGELVEIAVPGITPLPIGTYYLMVRQDRWHLPAIKMLARFLRKNMAAAV